MPPNNQHPRIGPRLLERLRKKHEHYAGLKATDDDGFENYVRRFIKKEIAPLVRKIWISSGYAANGQLHFEDPHKLYVKVLETYLQEELAEAELVIGILAADSEAGKGRLREEVNEAAKKLDANNKAIKEMREED